LNHEQDQYYHISDDLKSLADFQKGSFWIYHNDSLNINDTVSVIDNKLTLIDEHFDSHENYIDQLNITLKSSYKDSVIYDRIYGGRYSRTYIEYKKDTGLFVKGFRFDGPTNSTQYLYNYILNGKLIDSVICYTSANVYGNQYYFAFNYGIIKIKDIENSHIVEWSLIKYNLVK
jgi:hypothetical protein